MPAQIDLGDVQDGVLQELEARVATDTNGDFVIEDSNENVVMRYDESEGQWVLESLSTEELRTAPTGALVQLDGDQSIANDTLTDVEWETETSRGEVSNILDVDNNVVVVPSGYESAKVTVNLNFETEIDLDFLGTSLNGSFSGDDGHLSVAPRGNLSTERVNASSAWIDVEENDELGLSLIQTSGQAEDLEDDARTYMEVWLL